MGDNISHFSYSDGQVLEVLEQNTLWAEFGTLRTMVRPEHCTKTSPGIRSTKDKQAVQEFLNRRREKDAAIEKEIGEKLKKLITESEKWLFAGLNKK